MFVDGHQLLDYDLRFFNMLGWPVRDYLEVIARPQSLHAERRSLRYANLHKIIQATPLHSITCQLDDTLAWVAWAMRTYSIHRIFVVDREAKPIGVIALLDLLTIVQKQWVPESN